MKIRSPKGMIIVIAMIIVSGFAISFTSASRVIQDTPAITSSIEQTGDTVHVYLHNNSNAAITVRYHLEGSYNVNIQSKGGTTRIPAGENVCVITTTVATPNDWNTGNLKYSW